MEAFVAKQPIFTSSQSLFAYELLYRNSPRNMFPDINGNTATIDLIVNSFLNIGIEELSNGKPYFINFTSQLLQIGLPTYFPGDRLVVEILETSEFTERLFTTLLDLKKLGYTLALDDFVFDASNPYMIPILELTDIIKVDFLKTDRKSRLLTERMAHKYRIKLLAEKIETKEEYEAALQSGYEYFQGYFFSEPIILSTRDIPINHHKYYEIIHCLSREEPDIQHIAQIIENDLSLSYKLLKLINSPGIRPIKKVHSIKQAIVLLGFTELRKWIFILSIREKSSSSTGLTNELLSISLSRAHLCERIALETKQAEKGSAYFLTGMFSMMDSLLGKRMEEILPTLPLQDDIASALFGEHNEYKQALDLCVAIEKGDWIKVENLRQVIGLGENSLIHLYKDALQWSKQLLDTYEQHTK